MSKDPIGYKRKDVNLYRYVENNPIAFTDPAGLRNFPEPPAGLCPGSDAIYYCERPVNPDGQDTGTVIARKCNWKHIDIYSVCQGKIYHGAGGGQTGSTPGLPKSPDANCFNVERKDYDYPCAIWLTRIERKMKWGPKRNLPCWRATMGDIIACLQARTTHVDPGLLENCQTDCNDALMECCMGGFTPLTIMPPWVEGGGAMMF